MPATERKQGCVDFVAFVAQNLQGRTSGNARG